MESNASQRRHHSFLCHVCASGTHRVRNILFLAEPSCALMYYIMSVDEGLK
jgi:hypothetical protein